MAEFHHEPSGQFVCNFLSHLPTTDTGRPFNLYPWQTEAITEFYGTLLADEDTGEIYRRYQYLFMELPKKTANLRFPQALAFFT